MHADSFELDLQWYNMRVKKAHCQAIVAALAPISLISSKRSNFD
jgi:hypothetical protein